MYIVLGSNFVFRTTAEAEGKRFEYNETSLSIHQLSLTDRSSVVVSQ